MNNKLNAVILDGYTENPGDLSWEYLESVLNLKVYDRTPPELVVKRAKNAEIVIVNKVAITKDILNELPKLKFVATLATGYNQLDVAALRERNIPVSNIPSYSTNAVAQTVFSFILEFTNRVGHYTESVKSGEWSDCKDFCYWNTPLNELDSKTLGIIGFGKIGRRVSEIALSFNMNVLVYTPSGKKNADERIKFTTLEEVQKNSDYITLHCPLTEKTNELINADFISKMKTGASLINTARGLVINEKAVADALNSGKLSYFGADVLSTEPPKKDNPLLSSKNTFITPHIAWAAFETRQRLLEILNGNIKAFLEGSPINVVNM
ncbi:MAG: D-2-hydroxyacid dehydrogenase [Clostridia bacterium]|nr:D-2-hydroxyacid dehydrogenase [Clostridia bacterium]